jgi:hypothetical protein
MTDKAIAEHACKKYSDRVGRSAAARDLDAVAIELAARAHVQHARVRLKPDTTDTFRAAPARLPSVVSHFRRYPTHPAYPAYPAHPPCPAHTARPAYPARPQKSTFTPNWNCLAVPTMLVISPALATRPAELNTVLAGSPKFARFVMLNPSTRS